ncbi:MAG: FG-GAP repeat protein [Planctomycetota bacterium]
MIPLSRAGAIPRALLLALASTALAGAQAPSFNLALDPGLLAARARFGAAVAMSGDTAACGAPGDAVAGLDAGAAYVFLRDPMSGAFALRQVLRPNGIEAFDRFGVGIALRGNVLAVGAQGDDDAAANAGAVWVFARPFPGADFQFVQKLTSPQPAASDGFGASIDVDGSRIAVGAPRADVAALDAGAVFVFERSAAASTYVLDGILVDGAPGVGDALGTSVAMLGGTVLAGAERRDGPGGVGNAGAVLEFQRILPGFWTVVGSITSPAPGVDARFGAALDATPSGPARPATVAVGAPAAGAQQGALHVFERTGPGGWAAVQGLGPTGLPPAGALGTAVALDGDAIVAGAPGRSGGAGEVDVLRWQPGTGAWTLDRTASIPNPAFGDLVGAAVALSDGVPLVGIPGREISPLFVQDAGAVWALSFLGDLPGELVCAPGVVNSIGLPGSLLATGSLAVADLDLTLEAGFLPPGSFSLALVSRTTSVVVQPGGSQGTLCLGGSIGRLVQLATQAGPDGRATIDVDLSSLPQPTGAVAAQVGETWWFQVWYRDVATQVTSNYTDAVGLTFR